MKHLYLTVAVDLVAEGITEPVRITRCVCQTEENVKGSERKCVCVCVCVCVSMSACSLMSREVKVRAVKGEAFGSIGSRFATLTKRRLPAETFVLVVEKVST